MAAIVLDGASHTTPAYANLQIKYVTRLPDSRIPSSFFSSLGTKSSALETPIITATITENTETQSWKITTIIPDASTQPQSQTVKVHSWPMFAPEDSRLIASATTTVPSMPALSEKIEVEVPKRVLAEFDERRGKWVLEEGIYMFEIRSGEDLIPGQGIVKQVSVVGRIEWDE